MWELGPAALVAKRSICEGDVLNDIHAMIYIAALQQYMMAYRCKYCSFQYNTEYSACVSATVPVLTRLLQTELQAESLIFKAKAVAKTWSF